MKKAIFTTIIITFNLIIFGQTYSTGDGEWGSVLSSNTIENPDPELSGTVYDIARNDNFIVTDNVYTSTSLTGISLDNNCNLTVGDAISGGSDTLTVNGYLVTANTSTLTINEGDVLVLNGDMRDNRQSEIIVNGTLKITGDMLNWEGSDITVGSNGTILVGGDFTNAGGSTVVNNGTIEVGGTYSGNYTGNTPSDGIGSSVVLPIELVSFNAYHLGNSINLQWITASETNNDYFSIERSSDGINYRQIGTVKGAGNSSTSLMYNFVDYNAFQGINYYRLTQTDYDGKFKVFNPASVYNYASIDFKIGPNPASNYINLNIGSALNDNCIILVYNYSGAIVKSFSGILNSQILDVSELPDGTYIICISYNAINIKQCIVIQK
jgi:hypothetical protein